MNGEETAVGASKIQYNADRFFNVLFSGHRTNRELLVRQEVGSRSRRFLEAGVPRGADGV